MSDQSKTRVVQLDDPDNFSQNLSVGARDRGLGRVDYAVIQDGQPVAELASVRRDPDGSLAILPDLANARLFAAAPELYDACRSALQLFEAAGVEAASIRKQVRQLKEALARADGSEDSSEAGVGEPGPADEGQDG